MTVTATVPAEKLPTLGTVENPAIFYDGANALLAYQVAPVEGGGTAVLAFEDVFDLRILPLTVESLGSHNVPARPYAITEVSGTTRTEKWQALAARFWTLSFNDELVEIVFRKVSPLEQKRDEPSPSRALAKVIASRV